MDDDVAQDLRKWHIIKGISLPTLIVLIVQTSSLIWYAAQFTFEQKAQGSRLVAVEAQVNKVVDNSFTSIGPAAVAGAKMSALEAQVNQLQMRQDALREDVSRLKLLTDATAAEQDRRKALVYGKSK